MVPPQSGIAFTNVLSDAALSADSSLLSGSGVALGDVDNDGLCDVFLCSLTGNNKLFRNRGNWTFQDVTQTANVECAGMISRGAALADLDGDGDLDLLVTTRGAGTRLFRNNGALRFTDISAASGFALNTGSTSLALADVDGDNDLDVYVANFGVGSVLRDGGQLTTRMIGGKMVVVGRHAKRVKVVNGQFVEFGEPDALYINNGNNSFAAVPWEGGAFLDHTGKPVETPWDFGLAVQFRDLNHDLAPDIYVCNDFFTPDRVWINNGKGGFRAIPPEAIRKSSFAAMGVDFADINRDGHYDGLIVEMQAMDRRLRLRQMTPDTMPFPAIPGLETSPQTGRNTLLLARGDGTFAEIAQYANIAASDWSWMPAFIDVDLDGWEDVLIPNGHPYDLLDLDALDRGKLRDPRASGSGVLSFPKIQTPNRAFRNNHNLTFTEFGATWGFDSTHVSNGMAFADLDNDGDLDAIVNCLNAPALVLRNDSTASRVRVRLRGLPPNTAGIGAQVTFDAQGLPQQCQEIISGGRYQSCDEATRMFAMGAASNATISVTWRNGSITTVSNVLPNTIVDVSERGAVPAPAGHELSRVTQAIFSATKVIPAGPEFSRPDSSDFATQPLLTRAVAPVGPRVIWTAKGPSLQAIAPLPTSGYFVTNGLPLLFPTNLPAKLTPIATMSVADFDNSGGPQVFVAPRANPRRFPEPVQASMLRLVNNVWQPDARCATALSHLGMVTASVAANLLGGPEPELIVACDWGGIRIFGWRQNQWTDLTAQCGLEPWTGWWQSLAIADFDNDGRQDIAAGNWGLNNAALNALSTNTPALFYGDFNADGTVQLMEAAWDRDSWLPVRDYKSLGSAMPFITAVAPNNLTFSEAGVERLLGPRYKTARQLRAATLASMVFMNRGNRFQAMRLPAPAQFSPACGIAAADCDGDGHLDLYLAQNASHVPNPAWAQDAGCGLLLKGKGDGTFEAVAGRTSGITVFGEQTGAAFGDLDNDGKPDLAVATADGSLRIYKNNRASSSSVR